LAAVMLASSLGFILIGRVVFFDMLLAVFLNAALSVFYLWYVEQKKIYLYVFYVLLAAAFMTKGLLPVAIAFGVAITFIFLRDRSWRKVLTVFNFIGIALFLLLTAPWYIAASMKLPYFGWDYFINEQVLRFFNKRIPHDYHTGPWYFYLPRILIYVFPWSLFLPTLFKRIRGRFSAQDPLKIFLWIWFLVPLVVFSLSGAKGDYYMFLGVPPLLMLLAFKFDEYIKADKHLLSFTNFIIVIGAITLTALYVMWKELMPSLMQPQLRLAALFFSIFFVIGFLLGVIYRKPLLNIVLTAIVIAALLFWYVNFKAATENIYTQLTIAQYVKAHDNQRTLYLFQDYEKMSTVLFYLERRLPIIDSVSQDLYFGSKTPDAQGWFINSKDFIQQASHRTVYVVMLKQRKDVFDKVIGIEAHKFCVVAESERALLLSNVGKECALGK
jgi:4-amino-4-deoxy-L-arabinose transferase-like glycosyltransferase